MSIVTHSRRPFRFQGRSFLAFVLTPDEPVPDWLDALDTWAARSPDFFTSRPVILDLSRLPLTKPDLAGLLAQLQTRQFRLIGVEGVDPSWLGPGLAPLPGGKGSDLVELNEVPPETTPLEATEPAPEQSSLLLNAPVRSGQSIFFPAGDVTVAGSVASGAEIVSGGSIHVYGALRGRAFAGSTGNASARIFCRRFEAELLVIGGFYKTADDITENLRGRPVQAWLDGDMMTVTALD